MHCGKSDSFRSSEQSTSNLSAVAVSSERAISQTVPHCFMFDFEQLNDLSLEKHHRERVAQAKFEMGVINGLYRELKAGFLYILAGCI